MSFTKFTDDQIEYIINNYNNQSYADIAEHIGVKNILFNIG